MLSDVNGGRERIHKNGKRKKGERSREKDGRNIKGDRERCRETMIKFIPQGF